MTKRGSLLRGSLWTFGGQVIPLVFGLVAVPQILAGLGVQRFGLLSMIWVVIGNFGMLDLGLGRAVTRLVAKELEGGRNDRLPAIVWSSVAVQLAIGVFSGAVLILAVPALASLLRGSDSAEGVAALRCMALALPLHLASGSFRGVVESAERFGVVNRIRMVSGLAGFAVPWWGANVGASLPQIVMGLLLIRVGVLIAYVAAASGLIPNLFRDARVERATLRSLFGFGGWVSVSGFCGPILGSLERYLIGALLSVTSLSFYAAPLDALSKMLVFPASLASVLFPRFSLLEDADVDQLRALAARSVRVLFALLWPCLMLVLVFADRLLDLWLGAEFAQRSTTVVRLLAISIMLNGLAMVPYTLVHGLGRPDWKAKLDVIELFVFAGLSWFLLEHLGLVGAAAAKLVVSAMDTILLFWMSSRLAGRVQAASMHAAWRAMAVNAIGLWGGLTFARWLEPFGFAVVTATCLVALSAYVVCSMRFGLTQDERTSLRDQFTSRFSPNFGVTS